MTTGKYNSTLLDMLRACQGTGKQAFVDTSMVDPAAGGMPPGGAPPGGMPPGGMPPGMDPSMMGGAPPGMDPSMMGGMPPGGAPPGMDPAMMGGAPPGMDPAMMGGAPPGMDPSMMGGAPPPADPAAGGAPAPGGDAPLTADMVRQIVQEAMAGGAGGKPKEKKVDPGATIAALQTDMHQTKMLLAHLCSAMNLPIDPVQMLQSTVPKQDESGGGGGGDSAGGASGGGDPAKTAAICGYPGYGVPVDMNAVMTASLRGTLGGGIGDLAQKAAAIADILNAKKRMDARVAKS